MTREEQVALLTRSVGDWNKMRSEDPAFIPDLNEADLHGGDLRQANLAVAKLFRANLRQANLSGANLSGANLFDADLSKTDLSKADLSKADLSGAKLRGANLIQANLSFADLRRVNLSKANLRFADLRKVNFSEARFTNADLTGADLCYANLSNADIQRTVGLTLDQNDIRGARFSPYARDSWSVLRRNYTGPMLLFHLLLLLAFLVPYAMQVANWIVINQGQRVIQRMTQSMQVAGDRISKVPVVDNPSNSAIVIARREEELRIREEISNQLHHMSQLKPCLADDCVQTSIWRILIGLHRGPLYAGLAVSLIIYNIIRVILTRKVGALREEEERSGYAPRFRGFSGYQWLHWLHQFAFCLLVINICSLTWHAWDWLNRPVWLPKL